MNALPKVRRLVPHVIDGKTVLVAMMVTLCPPRHASGVLPLHLDPIGGDRLALGALYNLHESNLRGDPCEDDCEVTTGSILDPIDARADHLPEGFGTAEIMGFASQPSRS